MAFDISKFNDEWISEKLESGAIDFAESFGEYLCDVNPNERSGFGRQGMTTTQIRNFFNEVKRIQAKVLQDGFDDANWAAFLLLRPKLAYSQGRATAKGGKSRITEFRTIMDKAHRAVIQKERSTVAFQRFVDFLEATLAYHKLFGGRD